MQDEYGTPVLTDNDLALLASITGQEEEELRAALTASPWAVHDVLSSEAVFGAVVTGSEEQPVVVSPLLLFGVLVHRAADDLRHTDHVNDWTGRSMRIPVLDVQPLREFSGAVDRLSFLAELMASFVVPQPGPLPMVTLDLGDLAVWLDAVEPTDRPGLLRRLGDVALFSAGVYPDRTGPRCPSPEQAERWGRSLGLSGGEILDLTDARSPSPGLDLLDSLGPRWYGAAAAEGPTAVPPVVLDVANRFRSARRFLTHLADRYLHTIEPTLGLAL